MNLSIKKIFSTSALLSLIAIFILSCSGNHLICDSQYRETTEKAFNQRKHLAINRDTALFSVFNQKLSLKQSEALKFLYAYMPLSDLADYNGNFFLANADMSLRSKSETAWGKDIPEEVFLHYVLQCRSTMLSARGRCGEESTFTVAALRTVGIPSRQVYTPQWAHSDDNHAWVEIWFNGDWYYMGACEPEPILDRGWFTEPARRAMLVYTKSFGTYSGNENAIFKYPHYTNVNNLSKYAFTKKIFVKVFDKNNLQVNNAQVEYQLSPDHHRNLLNRIQRELTTRISSARNILIPG